MVIYVLRAGPGAGNALKFYSLGGFAEAIPSRIDRRRYEQRFAIFGHSHIRDGRGIPAA